jgi:hypothetical protein|nr:MAG TPA: hypothetical protein [Caudoviricetes sp.]
MLELKTKLSSIKLDENITISRKGKNPLELEYEKRFIDYLQPKENYLYLIIGVYKSAYCVKIDVSLTEDMINEILEWYFNNKPLSNVTIKAQKITIKEFW